MSDQAESRDRGRIVVTGIGAVSPFGPGVDVLWEGLARGEERIRPVELFSTEGHRTRLAAEVRELPDGLPAGLVLPRGSRPSRTDRFALHAAHEAWRMAGLPLPAPAEAGLFLGSSTGGLYEGEEAYWRLRRTGPERARAKPFAPQPNGTPADAVALAFGLTGPVEALATACAASTMALEAALDSLRAGEVRFALAGGSDGLCQTTFGGFNSLRAVDEAPARPFREDREGLSLGEGAGFLVLETEAEAAARGATILAVLAGAGSTCDAFHMTAPGPEGAGAARAMRLALEDAGVAPEAVGFLDAHGSGTPHNDRAEAAAIRAVFGEHAATLPVTSSKGAVGHTLGSCGSLEAVITVLCLLHGRVHPTPGAGTVDPEARVDLVLGEPRAIDDARPALSLNLAFGGANAAVVLRKGSEAAR